MVRWHKGSGAGSLGGADATPTMTAVKRKDEPGAMRHGHDAMRARMIHPSSWELFFHLKLAFVADAPTADIAQVLARQEEKAAAMGLSVEEVATAFFTHLLQQVTERHPGSLELYFNISDSWSNRKAQELVQRFQKLAPRAEISGIDECFASLVGSVGRSLPGTSAEGFYVVVDCGHSTMVRASIDLTSTSLLAHLLQNIGCATISIGDPRFKTHKYDTHNTGAGAINAAAENEVRRINRVNGIADVEKNVWEVSDYIDEFFKPDADTSISSRAGYDGDEWESIIGCAGEANKQLDIDRVKLIQATLDEVTQAGDSNVRILLTGRGTLSKTFLSSLQDMIDQRFPDVRIQDLELDNRYGPSAPNLRIAVLTRTQHCRASGSAIPCWQHRGVGCEQGASLALAQE